MCPSTHEQFTDPNAERSRRTSDVAAFFRDESRAHSESQIRESMEYHALVAHSAASQYQRDLSQFVVARCAERDPRARALLADVEHALRSASDTARASGDLAADMVERARSIESAVAKLQAYVADAS